MASSSFDNRPGRDAQGFKNATEIAGIRKAHHRDGIALCRFLAWLDEEVSAGRPHDDQSRSIGSLPPRIAELKDLSFGTISAAGPNARWPITRTNGTPASLTMDSVYLVDSGGQYLDGTTDVTRTIAIGNPSAEHKEMFTGS